MKKLCVLCLFALKTLAQPLPTARHLAWQKLETTAFLHFTVNTFTDKEWGDGTESPQVFNPTHLDTRQWVKALKEGGFKMAIITAKHHDGFCLWPTQTTDHSVENSPWKNGKGDVVRELANACREYGLKFGFYLSPWDRHEPSYGTAAYNDFYKRQLRELLTQYGEVSEVWFDGARGENAKDMQYDFEGFWALVRQLQPQAVMFSDVGPDVRWVGNESGNAGETCWSAMNTEGMAPGKADEKYLNVGDPKGKHWIPAETDVSIRKGWFYHPNEEARSPQNLVNLYYQSVGRNSLLLLNIPPNQEGLLSAKDIQHIKEFRSILNETFETNLIPKNKYKLLIDSNLTTYKPLVIGEYLTINFGKNQTLDRAMIQENITQGQAIEAGVLEYWTGTAWQVAKTFSTVGHKRLLRFEKITTSQVRIAIQKALRPQVEVAEMGFYKASGRE